MPRRQWDAKPTALIILAGLKGKLVAERCPEPQIRQALYDAWRDQCLAHAAKAVEAPQRPRQEARLEQATARLKPRVGALTFERNKRDAWLG